MALNSASSYVRQHYGSVGCTAAVVLFFCCVVPRRTESYFRTDLPRAGDRPVNRVPTDLPVPEGVESFVNSVGMRMIRVPTGQFVVGSASDEPGRRDDEWRRNLQLDKPFYISQTEVTQAEWCAIMEFNPSQFVGDRLPVQNVRPCDGALFCKRLSAIEGREYFLPTEFEWEYACRAGSQTSFNTGSSLLESQARFASDARNVATQGPDPVGSYPPNAWGLYDMHGNVAECGANPYSPNCLREEMKSQEEVYHLFRDDAVLRGGSWESRATDCRSARRDHANRMLVDATVGFRVIMVEE